MTRSTLIRLESGKINELQRSGWFFARHITPTGLEVPLRDCPHLTFKDRGPGENSDMPAVRYTVSAPTRLKLINIVTSFGRPRRAHNIVLRLDPQAAVIRIHGIEGLGSFLGRAEVDFSAEDTTFKNLKDLKSWLTYEIVSPPPTPEKGEKTGKGQRRKLLW